MLRIWIGLYCILLLIGIIEFATHCDNKIKSCHWPKYEIGPIIGLQYVYNQTCSDVYSSKCFDYYDRCENANGDICGSNGRMYDYNECLRHGCFHKCKTHYGEKKCFVLNINTVFKNNSCVASIGDLSSNYSDYDNMNSLEIVSISDGKCNLLKKSNYDTAAVSFGFFMIMLTVGGIILLLLICVSNQIYQEKKYSSTNVDNPVFKV